ncbi:MAG: dihydrofolate reductase [Candidatus Gracilibacteria bacterium]
MKPKIYVIAAVDKIGGLAKEGGIPWHYPSDMKFFKQITSETLDPAKHNIVIMGRKTWETIPDQFRPLPGRENIVLSSNKNLHLLGATVVDSLEHVLYREYQTVEKIFIIGGAQLYHTVMELPDIDGVYLTRIQKNYDCDLFFPDIPEHFTKQIHIRDTEETGDKLEFWYYGK